MRFTRLCDPSTAEGISYERPATIGSPGPENGLAAPAGAATIITANSANPRSIGPDPSICPRISEIMRRRDWHDRDAKEVGRMSLGHTGHPPRFPAHRHAPSPLAQAASSPSVVRVAICHQAKVEPSQPMPGCEQPLPNPQAAAQSCIGGYVGRRPSGCPS